MREYSSSFVVIRTTASALSLSLSLWVRAKGEGCPLLGFAFFCRFLALRDDRIKRSQRGYKWLSWKPRWRSHDIAFDATKSIPPSTTKRTSSNTYSAALPIKGIPRCSTTTNSFSDHHRIPCAWSLHRYHDAQRCGALPSCRGHDAPTRPSHAHQALLIALSPVHILLYPSWSSTPKTSDSR